MEKVFHPSFAQIIIDGLVVKFNLSCKSSQGMPFTHEDKMRKWSLSHFLLGLSLVINLYVHWSNLFVGIGRHLIYKGKISTNASNTIKWRLELGQDGISLIWLACAVVNIIVKVTLKTCSGAIWVPIQLGADFWMHKLCTQHANRNGSYSSHWQHPSQTCNVTSLQHTCILYMDAIFYMDATLDISNNTWKKNVNSFSIERATISNDHMVMSFILNLYSRKVPRKKGMIYNKSNLTIKTMGWFSLECWFLLSKW